MDPDPTEEEQYYIDRYDIPSDRVIYADGLRGKKLREVMRENEAWVAYGARPCQAKEHTLRLRSGHCFPCRPAGLTYLKKYDLAGEVYLARAGDSSIYKFGVSDNPSQRIAGLNAVSYGGSSNWRLVISRYYPGAAGIYEYIARLSVQEKSVRGGYCTSDAGWVVSREMFCASDNELDEIIKKVFNRV